MKFRTEYKPDKAGLAISPRHPILLIGSCFSQNIASRMRDALWNASNPFGVLYNPLSIERAIRATVFSPPESHTEGLDDSVIQIGRVYHSWLFDSKVADESLQRMKENVRHISKEAKEMLGIGATLIVTFGTAWVYSLTDRDGLDSEGRNGYVVADREGYVVANCHKQPAAMFTRRRLSVDEIVERWEILARDLKNRYPGLEILFTVSPVRHLKDGFHGNACSKATLMLAVEQICTDIPFCHYFPAYEILNDDLRDYRFYASDLLHPSEEAVDYLWEIFRQTYIDEEGNRLLDEGDRLHRALCHRPLYNGTKSDETLLEEARRREALEEQCRRLKERWPEVAIDNEV